MNSIELNYEIFEDFDTLKDIWLSLEKVADIEVFNSFYWCKSWCHSYGLTSSINLKIIVIYSGAQPVSIFPLCIRNSGFTSILEFIGEPFNDYNAPLINSDRIKVDYLIEYLFNSIIPTIKYDLLLFLKQTNWLPKKYYSYFSRVQKDNSGHSIVINESWKDFYESHFNRKSRYKNRRLLNILQKNGDIKFESEKHFGLEDTLNILMKYKSESYQRLNVTDFFKFNKNADNYLEFIKELYYCGYVDIKCLLFNDEIIAVHCGFIYKDCFYYIMPSYDFSYKQFSPGKVLLNNLIECAFNENLGRFDFTIGDEPYKKEWFNRETSILTNIKFRTFYGFISYVYYLSRTRLAKSKLLRKIYAFRM